MMCKSNNELLRMELNFHPKGAITDIRYSIELVNDSLTITCYDYPMESKTIRITNQ